MCPRLIVKKTSLISFHKDTVFSQTFFCFVLKMSFFAFYKKWRKMKYSFLRQSTLTIVQENSFPGNSNSNCSQHIHAIKLKSPYNKMYSSSIKIVILSCSISHTWREVMNIHFTNREYSKSWIFILQIMIFKVMNIWIINLDSWNSILSCFSKAAV